MIAGGKPTIRLAFYLAIAVLAGALLLECVLTGRHLLAVSAAISCVIFARAVRPLVR